MFIPVDALLCLTILLLGFVLFCFFVMLTTSVCVCVAVFGVNG